MSFQDTHEKPLRTFIETRARTLQNTIETAAQNRDANNVVELEKQIDRESDRFVEDVTARVNGIRDQIKARRPTDDRSPDYAERMNQYKQYVSLSSTGINQVTTWVNRIFKKIIDVIKNIVEWINDMARTIIGILELIRNSFNEFITSFLK
ncbi:unnamed protein product [Adineta ricciae]|uniref:Uncharacterized protein n=1 Tax=Adineta ricciae TaxID=249248 RepID=A0A815MXQ7_ADIRI|nr:unnamed protein product [Adineta ricciae]CAF1431187.1 unnamed protein product [Adineta ricciae]